MLTYTQVNQAEVRGRISSLRSLETTVEVMGWFSFLMTHFIKPYLPTHFPNARLLGLNFDGDPGRYVTGQRRFLDKEGKGYKRHLAQLALDVSAASNGAVLDRLARLYDTIHIDEAQDLNGYDLDVLKTLIHSPIRLQLVGDIRQAILMTNPKDPRNAQYKGIKVKAWFDEQAQAGELEITHQNRTWRSNQTIADFADSIFDTAWGFPRTESMNKATTSHDGVFQVSRADAIAYTQAFSPLCLRHSKAVGKDADLPFINIGVAKGMDAERVLIWPTKKVLDFIQHGKKLDATPSCSLYVAVTRARASVAFVVPTLSDCGLPVWQKN